VSVSARKRWLLVIPSAAFGAVVAWVRDRPPAETPAPVTPPSAAVSARRAPHPPPVPSFAPAAPIELARKHWRTLHRGEMRMEEAYDAEARDPEWAPAMEAAMATRFREPPPTLRGLVLSEVECHTTLCKLVWTFPVALADAVQRQGVADGLPPGMDPMEYMFDLGPFAHGSNGAGLERVTPPGGVPSWRATYLGVIDRDEITPASYATWAAARQRRMADVKRRMIQAWAERKNRQRGP
jgi:hypothetical protein